MLKSKYRFLNYGIVVFIVFFLEATITARPRIESGRIAPGAGSVVLMDGIAHSGKQLPVHYYIPAHATADSPIAVLMHGVTRDGRGYRDSFIDEAIKYNLILLVPEFRKREFPNSHYHGGNVRNRHGLVPRERWSYSIVDNVFKLFQANLNNNNDQYYLLGHSAGGQFVHRMLLFHPEASFKLAVAANAGYYTFPDLNKSFIYGVGNTHVNTRTLQSALERKMILALGAKDNDPHHKHLPKSSGAMAQGAHRLERGKNFYNFARDIARQSGSGFNWQQVIVPDAGHSSSETLGYIMPRIFDEDNRIARRQDDRFEQGEGRYIFRDRHNGWQIPLWYYVPQDSTPATPVVFLTHGSDRDARNYRDQRIRLAAAYNFILIAPEFSEDDFSDNVYFQGNVFKSDRSSMRPNKQWTFSVLDEMHARVRSELNLHNKSYYVFGNTGSAHFPLRMSMLDPAPERRRVALANVLYYPEYDLDKSFPSSLKRAKLDNAHLARIFQQRIIVLAGADGRRHRMNDSKTALQGNNLYARSFNFYSSAKKKARALNVPLRWQFRQVQGTKWSYMRMFEAALQAWGMRKIN